MNKHLKAQIWLPYCVEKVSSGLYVVLNRNYKPIGVNTTNWVCYETDPRCCYIQPLSKVQMARLHHKSLAVLRSNKLQKVYLLRDIGDLYQKSLRHAYDKRLNFLNSLKPTRKSTNQIIDVCNIPYEQVFHYATTKFS